MRYFLKVSWCDSINIRTITNKLSIEFLINHCFSPDILVLQVSRMLSWKLTYSRKANIWICVGHVDKCGWWNPIKYVKDLNHQYVVSVNWLIPWNSWELLCTVQTSLVTVQQAWLPVGWQQGILHTTGNLDLSFCNCSFLVQILYSLEIF